MIHELKTIQPHFAAIKSGKKTFEIRKDDREFCVGHILYLNECDPASGALSGECVLRKITHILRDAESFGLMPGFAILSIAIV